MLCPSIHGTMVNHQCVSTSESLLLVTWCTNRFNIQKLYILPTLYICVLFLS